MTDSSKTAPAPAQPSFGETLAALRRSYDRLVEAVTPLTDDQLCGRSYDDDWTIAQVASHLGSSAEIFGLFLDAGLQQTPAAGIEQFQPVWGRWNAKSAPEQARDALRADAELLGRFDALTGEERAHWRLDLFGTRQNLVGLARMRLAEHALHTWDIRVALDASATVAEDAAELIIDNLTGLVDRVGKGTPEPIAVRVTTSSPDRVFLLETTTDTARLTPAIADTTDTTATMRLPGEAFVRLIYGRLDPDHTPESVTADRATLDALRRSFPGV